MSDGQSDARKEQKERAAEPREPKGVDAITALEGVDAIARLEAVRKRIDTLWRGILSRPRMFGTPAAREVSAWILFQLEGALLGFSEDQVQEIAQKEKHAAGYGSPFSLYTLMDTDDEFDVALALIAANVRNRFREIAYATALKEG